MAGSAHGSPLDWDFESKDWIYHHMCGPNGAMQGCPPPPDGEGQERGKKGGRQSVASDEFKEWVGTSCSQMLFVHIRYQRYRCFRLPSSIPTCPSQVPEHMESNY